MLQPAATTATSYSTNAQRQKRIAQSKLRAAARAALQEGLQYSAQTLEQQLDQLQLQLEP
jgi:hypothetical protein